jgi:uncharacterized SAM-binding protein YcdF (DUF218 family)
MKTTFANILLLLVFIGGAIWIKDLYEFSQVIRSSEMMSPLEKEDDVDLIVVLTGGQGRFKAGLELLRRFPKAWLLISGAETYVTLDDVLHANEVEDLDDKDRSRIWLGKFSRNTLENAVEVREIAEKVDARKILLVTSVYHIRRALQLVKRELAKSQLKNPKLYYHPVESPNFPKSGWWRKVIGWKIFFSEYFKSIQLLPPPEDEVK